MQKLLFLSLLTLSSAQAAQSFQNVSIVPPAGAKSLLIYSGMDKSEVYTVPDAPNLISLKVVVSDSGIRYAVRVSSGVNRFRSESTSSNDVKFVPPLPPSGRQKISPKLNEWVTLLRGQQETGFNMTLGGVKSRREPLLVALLFSNKPVERVPDGSKPPQKP